MSAPAPAYDLTAARAGVPMLDHTIPLNHCAQAPQTRATRAAAEAYLASWNEKGMDWETWIEEVEAARGAFARLIGAEPDEVAIFSSVSHATAALASTLDRLAERTGRRTIALTEAEFPTVAHVWKALEVRGTPLRWAPLEDGRVTPAAVESVLDRDVLLFSAAHAYYQNGSLMDLEHLVAAARAAGALTYVDAYQSLGALPLDVKALGVDILSCGSQKFLMGATGIAFLYVAREVAERLEPAVTGWFGREDPFAFDSHTLDWAPAARRFDTGTPPVLMAYIARAGLELLLDAGPEAIADWTRTLSGRLADGGRERGLELMGPADPMDRASITAFRVDDGAEVESAMRARGVLPSARGPAVRLAPHYFNTLDDMDRALDVLADVVGATG